jgi:rare lipoprotein A (peptidoglycan hydrolase)
MPFINGRFYMNPAYGRVIENARNSEASQRLSAANQDRANARWVTINGRHVLIQETHDGLEYHKDARKRSLLPSSGQESIYADWFVGKKTANGNIFSQDSYTAALLPEARWHAVPLGTRVELIHDGSQAVVEINDRGAGDRDPESTRVLDLSRAAASALTKQEINNDRDSKKAGVITLDRIKVVPANTPLGPVRP